MLIISQFFKNGGEGGRISYALEKILFSMFLYAY